MYKIIFLPVQLPRPERSVRAVRSVYNDGRRGNNGSTIPGEFLRGGGGGGVLGNGTSYSPIITAAAGGAGFRPGALTTSSEHRSCFRRPMSPLTLGGGRVGLSLSDGGTGGTLGVRVSAAGGSGGGGAGAEKALARRGSFQSNASVDFGLGASGGDEVRIGYCFFWGWGWLGEGGGGGGDPFWSVLGHALRFFGTAKWEKKRRLFALYDIGAARLGWSFCCCCC